MRIFSLLTLLALLTVPSVASAEAEAWSFTVDGWVVTDLAPIEGGFRAVFLHQVVDLPWTGGPPLARYEFISNVTGEPSGQEMAVVYGPNLRDEVTVTASADDGKYWLTEWAARRMVPFSIPHQTEIHEVLHPPGWPVILVKVSKDAATLALLAYDVSTGDMSWAHDLEDDGYGETAMRVIGPERVLFTSARSDLLRLFGPAGLAKQTQTLGGSIATAWMPHAERIAIVQADRFTHELTHRLSIFDRDLGLISTRTIPHAWHVGTTAQDRMVFVMTGSAIHTYDASSALLEEVATIPRPPFRELVPAGLGDRLWWRDNESLRSVDLVSGAQQVHIKLGRPEHVRAVYLPSEGLLAVAPRKGETVSVARSDGVLPSVTPLLGCPELPLNTVPRPPGVQHFWAERYTPTWRIAGQPASHMELRTPEMLPGGEELDLTPFQPRYRVTTYEALVYATAGGSTFGVACDVTPPFRVHPLYIPDAGSGGMIAAFAVGMVVATTRRLRAVT